MKKTILMRGMKVLNVAASIALFAFGWYGYYASGRYPGLTESGMLICAFYAILLVIMRRVYNAYDVGGSRVSELIYSLSLSDVIVAGIVYVVASVSGIALLNPLPLLGIVVLQGIWNAVWSLVANKVYFRIHKAKKTVIIYEEDNDLKKLEEIKYFSSKFDVQKYMKNPVDDIHAIIREIEGYDVVFVAGIPATLRNGIVKYCVEQNVQGYIAPHVGDVIMAGATYMQMFSVPLVRVRRSQPSPEYLFIKRAFDIFVSLIGIIVTSPVMLVTAIAIMAYDHGPALYKQVRLTKDGREFKILKFRSMRVNAEKDGVARLASAHDDRITPVGHFIRACRLDELPQLFNILKGDMTIVGPRPERPEIAAQYEEEMPAFNLRLQVKAGLTGFAQVEGRYNTTPYDKLQMDLMYINSMSVSEDLRLMFATVKILFMKDSTEGVAEGQVTASRQKAEKQTAAVVQMKGREQESGTGTYGVVGK